MLAANFRFKHNVEDEQMATDQNPAHRGDIGGSSPNADLQALWWHLRLSKHMPYAYMNVPKAACSTIMNTLWALEHSQGHISHLPESWDELHGLDNTPWLDIRGRQYDAVATSLSGKYLFSVVRNPFERVLSAYLDQIRRRTRAFETLCEATGWPPDKDMTFTEFVELVAATPETKMNLHWRPQTRILLDFPLEYNLIGRVENLDQVMHRVGSMMSLQDGMQLRTYTPHATSAADQLGGYYNEEAIRLVTRIYGADFEAFGFDMRLERQTAAVHQASQEREDRLADFDAGVAEEKDGLAQERDSQVALLNLQLEARDRLIRYKDREKTIGWRALEVLRRLLPPNSRRRALYLTLRRVTKR